MSTSERPVAAVSGANGVPSVPVCLNSVSGQAFRALYPPPVSTLSRASRTRSCPANQVCAVNTCCDDTPGPNLFTPVAGPEWQCQATGPFTCEDQQPPYFPDCVRVGIPVPTLSPAWIAAGLLLLTAIGAAALRGLRRSALTAGLLPADARSP